MDWKTTALVVIDMENAFISKESPLCIQGDSQGERKRDSGILCEPHLSQKRQ